MGLGNGQSGAGGSGYFLLMILFVELFGVTMGQVNKIPNPVSSLLISDLIGYRRVVTNYQNCRLD